MAKEEQGGIGGEFMRLTRYAHAGPSDQRQGVEPPPVFHSLVPSGPRLDLPSPGDLDLPSVDFQKLVA